MISYSLRTVCAGSTRGARARQRPASRGARKGLLVYLMCIILHRGFRAVYAIAQLPGFFQICQQLMAADGGVQVSGVHGTAEEGTDHVLVGGQGHVQLARPGAAQHRVLHKGRLVQLAARQGIDRQCATGGHEALQGTAPAAVRVDGALRFPLTIAEKVLDDEVKGLATIVLHKEPRIRLDQRGLPWPDAEKASCEGEVEAVQVDARDGNAGEPLAQELHGSTTTHAEQQYPLYTRER